MLMLPQSSSTLTPALTAAAIAFLTASTAFAAKITATSAKTGMVKIDESGDKGVDVCFFKASKEVGCGKIVKKTASAAFVKVPKSMLPKLKKGMRAELAGSSTSSGSKTKSAGKTGPGPYSMAFYGIFNPAIAGPSAFNTEVAYKAPPTDGSASTLFDSKPMGMALYSFGSQFDWFLSYPFGLGGGFRMRFFQFHPEIESNYTSVLTETNRYVRSSQNASEFGMFVSGMYYYSLGDDMGIKFNGGLDIDMSTVKFSAGEWDGDLGTDPATHQEVGRLYALTSNLTVISLKMDAFYSMAVAGPLVLDAGMTLFLPISASRSGSPEVTDPNLNNNTGVNADNDLLDAINHRSVFGIEFLMALGIKI